MNSSGQSIMQRILLNFWKDAGNVCAVISLVGNGFKLSSSFSSSSIHVLNILESVDTETLNLSDRPGRNRPT